MPPNLAGFMQQITGLLGGGGGGVLPFPAGDQAPALAPAPAERRSVNWDAFESNDMVENIKLDHDLEGRIKTFLHEEIYRSYKFFRTVFARVKEYREQYDEFRPDKHFPWEDSSNLAVAMTAPTINQMVGRNERIVTSTKPGIMVQPLPGISEALTDSDLLGALEEFINAKMVEDPHFMSRFLELMLESAITGTGLAKVFWETRKRDIKRFDFETGIPLIKNGQVIDFEGSQIEPFHLEDFLLPPEMVRDPEAIQKAHWVAQRYRERWGVLEQKIEDGIYRQEAKLLFGQQDQTDTEEGNVYIDKAEAREYGEIQGPMSSSANELALYEVWCRFNVEEGEPERECMFVYSYRRQILLAARYNPFFHGRRPFVKLPYWPLSDSFYGRGIAEELRHSQWAANDILNAGIDALTLANTGVWKASKAAGIKPGKNDRMWAGRVIVSDDADSIVRMDMPNPSIHTMAFVEHIDRLGQRASGGSENLFGQDAGAGNRETAEGALARAGGQSPMGDIVVKQIRTALSDICELNLSNYQQYKPEGDDYLKYAVDGKLVAGFFQMPRESVIGQYRFIVVASTMAANSEIRKSSLSHLMATIGPIYDEMIALIPQMANPQAPMEIMKEAFRSKLDLARELVQAYDMPGAKEKVPRFEKVWPGIEEQVMQMRQEIQNKPPPLDETIMRSLGLKWDAMFDDERLETLIRIGYTAKTRKAQLGETKEAGGVQTPIPGGPVGGPPAPGPGGSPRPPV